MTADLTTPGGCLNDETLTDYLEGVFDPAIKAAAEAHLVACDRCRRKLSFFMHLMKSEVKADEQVELQAAVELWATIRKDRRLPAWRGNRRRWMML